jgi:hypothetical protein
MVVNLGPSPYRKNKDLMFQNRLLRRIFELKKG